MQERIKSFIEYAMANEGHGETWADIVRLNTENAGNDPARYEIEKFIAWTAKRVYFCVTYDSSFWAESVPRDPCDELPEEFGGG